MCLPGPAGYTSEMLSYVWAHMVSGQDPDLELGGGSFVWPTLLAFLDFVISTFLPKIRGSPFPLAPPPDPPLLSVWLSLYRVAKTTY